RRVRALGRDRARPPWTARAHPARRLSVGAVRLRVGGRAARRERGARRHRAGRARGGPRSRVADPAPARAAGEHRGPRRERLSRAAPVSFGRAAARRARRRSAEVPGGGRRSFLPPEVVQTWAMDCGPATLACLLRGFGIPASYGRIREACQTEVDGTSIDTMEEIAKAAGLDADQV